MQCISPLLVKQKYGRRWIPCGKCNFCLERRRFGWSFRLHQELGISRSAFFFTLTYRNEDLPFVNGLPSLWPKDAQDWLKRFRKLQAKYSDWKLRYYLIGEYGEDRGKRPHYHVIIFNVCEKALVGLRESWGHGNVRVGTVTDASIWYVLKFHVNPLTVADGRVQAFSRASLGIGKNYLTREMIAWHKEDDRHFAVMKGGYKVALPRYYRDKIFGSEVACVVRENKDGTFSVRPKTNNVKSHKRMVIGIEESTERHVKELSRIARTHPNPLGQWEERVRFAHENVKVKSNKNRVL